MGTVPLSISASGIDTVILDFNAIKVYKSITGQEGALIALTDGVAQAATLTAIDGNYDVAGLTLSLSVDLLDAVDILFEGSSVLTPAQVAEQINEALGQTVAVDTGTALSLVSEKTGTASKVVIEGGSAASVFGWSEGDYDGGEEEHVALVAGQTSYTFLDKDGDSTHLYKVQYVNTSTGLTSELSDFFEGGESTLVGSEKLSLAKLDMVDARGVAVSGQVVMLYPQHEVLSVDGFKVALNKEPIKMETDNAGHAEVSLVRGLRMRVVVEGTSVIRDVTVPDADSFDLLSVAGSGLDPFTSVTLPFNAAIRRSI